MRLLQPAFRYFSSAPEIFLPPVSANSALLTSLFYLKQLCTPSANKDLEFVSHGHWPDMQTEKL